MGLTAGPYQRMMMALLPPGKLWRLIEGTLSALFLACADELARIDARASDLLRESDPRTAIELLPEHERELRIVDAGSTNEERQARIVARLVARQRFRSVDFQLALATLLGQDPDDVVVMERTHAMAAAMGDVREIYRFFIYRDPTLPGIYYLDSAQKQIDAIDPSHTVGHAIESIDFLCDDSFSLCDSDLLGA